MQIHVARNGEKFGPYSVEEVRARLNTGELSPADLGWYEGLAQWMPLGNVMAAFPGTGNVPPPPMPMPIHLAKGKSGLAKASFIIGILTSILWIVIFGYLASVVGRPRDADGQVDPVKAIAGLVLILNIVGSLTGFILGIIAVTKPSSNRWMAITGIALNGLAPIVIFFVVATGLAVTHHHSQFQYQE